MAAGGGKGLDATATWPVALVCAVIVLISIILEKIIHILEHFLLDKQKQGLHEALVKIKNELMVLGFISLLLTFGQSYIAAICVNTIYTRNFMPCKQPVDKYGYGGGPSAEHGDGAHKYKPKPPPIVGPETHRRLLWNEHRILAGGGGAKTCKKGYVPLITVEGLHQLHIFIFFLAAFHVIYSALTMIFGRAQIRGWKNWEKEIMQEQEAENDPSRFRLTKETSFVKGHTSFWTQTPVLFYLVCFFRQFFRGIRKSDYLAMRHGFITVHLAPGSNFNFQKYIKRSLEDDFKVIVGISPLLWSTAVLYLFANVDGAHAMIWLSVFPVIIILAVGTKLQAIIAQMAVEIEERHAVVQGIPLVQVSDRHFWFSQPTLILYLIQLTLFQNAFEITHFFWIWYEGLDKCYHEHKYLQAARVVIGFAVQGLCSYSTLPLYALVTQMGSTMKRSIFDDQTSKALKSWHKNAQKKKETRAGHLPTKTLGHPTDSPAQTQNKGIELGSAVTPNPSANIVASVDIPDENRPSTTPNLI